MANAEKSHLALAPSLLGLYEKPQAIFSRADLALG